MSEQPQITARLEVIEDDAAARSEPQSKTLTLTAEQILALEAEKASLMLEANARAAAARLTRPEPAPTVPLEDEPIVLPPNPELEAATIAVEEADAEIRAVEEEQRVLEARRAEALRLDQETHNARRAALLQKLATATREKQRLERIASGVHLKLRAEQSALEAERERQRAQATIDEKAAEIRRRVEPPLAVARPVLAELVEISHEHLTTLDSLGRMGWQDTPREWPYDLRTKFQQYVAVPAAKYAEGLRTMIASLRTTVEHATQLTKGWDEAQRVPTVDWDGYSENFGQKVNRIIQRLGYATEYVRAVRDQIAEVETKLAEIQEAGGVLLTMVASGEIAPPAPTVVAVTAQERANMMLEARLAQGGSGPVISELQTHAER